MPFFNQKKTIGKVPFILTDLMLAKIVQSYQNRYEYAHEEYNFLSLLKSITKTQKHAFQNLMKKPALLMGISSLNEHSQ